MSYVCRRKLSRNLAYQGFQGGTSDQGTVGYGRSDTPAVSHWSAATPDYPETASPGVRWPGPGDWCTTVGVPGCRPPPAAGAVEELPGLGCNRPWWPLPLLPLTATNRDASMEQVFFGIGNFFDVKVTKFPPHVHPVFAKMYSVHCTSPTRTADVFPATPNC